MEKIIAFIPVRGGSKGIPNKNIKLINKKPLVHWVIEAALGCNKINDVYVSTDSSAIADTVNLIRDVRLHVINRSKETATDQASTESAMLEFAEHYEFDKVILIQATSPLLKSDELDKAITSLSDSKTDSLLSVAQQKLFVWEDNNGYAKPVNYDYSARPRRQDFDGIYTENGAFYITSKDLLIESKCRMSGKIIMHIMPDNFHHEIDEPDDWAVIEHLLKNRNVKVQEKIDKIKLFATDVDGVLTDAGMYYADNGEEQKKFNTRDGKGIELLRNKGLMTAIITSEETKIVERRAAKLKIDALYQGVEDKQRIINEIIDKHNIKLDEVCYIGDDLNDLEVLTAVGFSCCPNDAVEEIKNIVDFICEKKGGEGCVRELCDLIIQKRFK
jgi:YrbI family 3-deoxy-D-manno-octulosonate 8-phosphate phosphatase